MVRVEVVRGQTETNRETKSERKIDTERDGDRDRETKLIERQREENRGRQIENREESWMTLWRQLGSLVPLGSSLTWDLLGALPTSCRPAHPHHLSPSRACLT